MRISLVLCVFLLIGVFIPANGQSEKVKVRINHTAIFVKDLKVTKKFYESIIGLDTIPEPFRDGKHAWYSIGPGVSMHVIEGAFTQRILQESAHLF